MVTFKRFRVFLKAGFYTFSGDYMINKKTELAVKIATVGLISVISLSAMTTDAYAASSTSGGALPSAGIDFILSGGGTSVKSIKEEIQEEKENIEEAVENSDAISTGKAVAKDAAGIVGKKAAETVSEVEEIVEEKIEKVVEETIEASTDKTVNEKERELDAKREEEGFKNLVIAKCNDYVNVRKEPSEEAEKIGKLYDKSAGEFISEQDGWYEIQSGSVKGFVKAEYCVTGDDAVELAKQVGTRVCTVDTTTLKVRGDASTESMVLGLVPMGEVLTVSEELEGWAKVDIEEGVGYVSLDYVVLSTEFVKAESKEEEEARLAKERKEREAAIAAAQAKANKNSSSNKKASENKVTYYASGEGSALGNEVANFALQFVGNPYVYGGTSLTNGADCSGFVLSVYKNFGVSLPHSANADRNQGYAVNGIENAQPGDLVCYSGHVGIYIGNGQIVHASTAKTGIKISNASYRSVLAVRRIF